MSNGAVPLFLLYLPSLCPQESSQQRTWQHSAAASDQLHFWLTFVQHSYFVAVMALKNISICQHAQVHENTMALLEKRWLFNEKLCCLPGEVAFTTAWTTATQQAARSITGLLLGPPQVHCRGGFSGQAYVFARVWVPLPAPSTVSPTTSFRVVSNSGALAACRDGLAWPLPTCESSHRISLAGSTGGTTTG